MHRNINENPPVYLKSAINVNKKKETFKTNDDEDDDNERTSCWENFQEYLLNTSLHALKYVGDITLSIFERVFFVIAFVIVMLMSAYFISNVWQKWSETPIIIGLNAVATPLKNIPFPAVTICNMNQARKSAVTNIDPNSLDGSLLESLCAQSDNFNTTISNRTGRWTYFRKFLLSVAHQCSDTLLHCHYANKEENCMAIFNSVLTDEGLCCTFNTVDPKLMFVKFSITDELDIHNASSDFIQVNWTPEKGYPKDVAGSLYPRPAAGAGSHMGLTLILDVQMAEYYCSTTSSSGFKILLHPPSETPKISEFGFFVSPGEETRVVITPRLSDASDLIRRVPKKQRQCIFANEGNLSYFRTYSKKNCEMECESRLTESICGCVLYYMPRTTDDTTICSRKDSECYEKIKLAVELANNETYSCSCLPGCFEIAYGRELSSSKLGNGSFEMREDFLLDKDPSYYKHNYAVVHIYFTETDFRSFTKGELIGFTEFLSNTGGLLGLFMGFSVLSLVEIFYFMSLRPYCVRRRAAKEQLKESNNNATTDLTNYNQKHNKMNNYNNSNKSNVLAINKKNQQPQKLRKQNVTKGLSSAIRQKINATTKVIRIKNTISTNNLDTTDVPQFPYYE